MRSMFDQQLKTLNEEMLYMGGLCEDTIQQTIEALMSGDVKKAHALNNMMSQLTQQERSIENICLKLLMQQQPVARDLRTISSSLKMVTDMERIGIQACEIAEIIAAGNVVSSGSADGSAGAELLIRWISRSCLMRLAIWCRWP